MTELSKNITIICDHREDRSGIPSALKQHGVCVKMKQLNAGDYIINDHIIVERKTKEDFVSSLINNRLFEQCSRLKRTSYNQVLLTEGNPYKTGFNVSNEAIKGALISIAVSWQIPTVFTHDTDDTVRTLISAGNQLLKENRFVYRKGHKPKAIMKKRLYLLQGLPMIGVTIANKLLERFGSIENVILASADELMEVEGIGKGKASMIKEFVINQ